jgi:hypothetical protein
VKFFSSLRGCLFVFVLCLKEYLLYMFFSVFKKELLIFLCIVLVWANGCETSLWIVLYFVDLDMFISNGLINAYDKHRLF